MLEYLYSYKHYTQYLFLKKEISIQICKLDNVVNSLEEMLAGYADPDAGYSDAAIKLINLTSYAYTDADPDAGYSDADPDAGYSDADPDAT